MKIGHYNKLIGSTTSGVTNSDKSINSDSLNGCYIASNETLTLTFSLTSLDFLALFNYTGTEATIKIYRYPISTDFVDIGYMYDLFIYDNDLAYTNGIIDTVVVNNGITTNDATGFAYSNYLIDISGNCFKIEITNTGSTTAFLGLAFAGEWINFDCVEAFQPFDNSNDDVMISRTNKPLVDESYLYQSFSATLKKENDLEDLKTKMRKILDTGYATSRPFLIDEDFYTVAELMLGILNGGRIGYDIYKTGDGYIAQTSFEVREVT